MELIELRSSNRDIQKELNEKQRLLSRKTKEYDELHSELENKHQLQLKEMQETNVSLRKRLNEIEKNCYEMESLRTSDINQHATFIQEMKSKHQLMLNNLDSKLKEIKIENDRLIYKQK